MNSNCMYRFPYTVSILCSFVYNLEFTYNIADDVDIVKHKLNLKWYNVEIKFP